MNTQTYLKNYLSDLNSLLGTLDFAVLETMIETLLQAWREGKRVLFMGNGGSSSTVSHISNDFQKNLQLEAGRALRTICLTDNTPLMVAWANDTAWENIFAAQVECWAEPGDVVIGVSGSGGSRNVLNGMETANRLGAITLGFAGYGGGKLQELVQHCLIVESQNMQRIEDVHSIALHLVFCGLLERAKQEVQNSK